MIRTKPPRRFHIIALYGLAVGLSVSTTAATTTNVSVVSFTYNPVTVTINAGDTVKWNWSGAVHSSTSDAGDTVTWDSTLISSGSFPVTFPSAGTFPYHCTLHGGSPFFMKGSVIVQSANAPPSVAINSPTNGTTFAASWTGTIQAAVSDSDGSVSTLDFFANTTHLGAITNPPANASFTVTNLAAGSYTLTAVATDNAGATNTSAGVSINVVTPVAIVVSAPQRVSPSAVQFDYSANPGLSYIVLRAETLPSFAPVSTNQATTDTVTYLDDNASGPANFYRVQLAPNP